MPVTEIPISQGTFINQDPKALKDVPYAERLINMLIDKAGANYDRPSLDLYVTLPSPIIIGMFYFKGFLIAVTFDRKVWSIDSSKNIVEISSGGRTLPGNANAIFASDGKFVYIVGGGPPIKWSGTGVTKPLVSSELTFTTGPGLNDLSVENDAYTSLVQTVTYTITIDGTAPDTFSWADDQGNSATLVPIAASNTLSFGLVITFAALLGHSLGNVWTIIVNLLPNFTHLTFLEGFLIGNRRIASENNKVIQWSDFAVPETWDGQSIFSADASPDEVQGVTSSQEEMWVVGQRTTEIWDNGGGFPVPWVRAFVWQYGTIAPYSIHSVDNSVFFIDQSKRILQFSGRNFDIISDQIQQDLVKYPTLTDCITSSFVWNGSIHVFFKFPSAGKGWSIDLSNKQWTEWRGFNNGWIDVRINASFYINELDICYAGDFNTGRIWAFSKTVKTDAQDVFVRNRLFSYRTLGALIRKNARFLRIYIDRNVASAYVGPLPQTNPTLEVRWNDDDKGWSNWRQIPLGVKGTIKPYVDIMRTGLYRIRQYEIRFSDPSPLRISKIETDEEVMSD